jgi:hypothetical protein
MSFLVCPKLKIEFTKNELGFQSGLSGWSFFPRQILDVSFSVNQSYLVCHFLGGEVRGGLLQREELHM